MLTFHPYTSRGTGNFHLVDANYSSAFCAITRLNVAVKRIYRPKLPEYHQLQAYSGGKVMLAVVDKESPRLVLRTRLVEELPEGTFSIVAYVAVVDTEVLVLQSDEATNKAFHAMTFECHKVHLPTSDGSMASTPALCSPSVLRDALMKMEVNDTFNLVAPLKLD